MFNHVQIMSIWYVHPPKLWYFMVFHGISWYLTHSHSIPMAFCDCVVLNLPRWAKLLRVLVASPGVRARAWSWPKRRWSATRADPLYRCLLERTGQLFAAQLRDDLGKMKRGHWSSDLVAICCHDLFGGTMQFWREWMINMNGIFHGDSWFWCYECWDWWENESNPFVIKFHIKQHQTPQDVRSLSYEYVKLPLSDSKLCS